MLFGRLLLSLSLNIGVMILAAAILTDMKSMRRLFVEERKTWLNQLLLSCIFGGLTVVSTCFGVEVMGAIVNTRVVSATAAGLIGGPLVGIGAGLIGGIHRYIYQPESFTALGCCVGTATFGLIGALAHKRFGYRTGNRLFLVGITIFGELCQVVWLLLLAHPLSAVLELERIILLPKIIINSAGMVLFFATFNHFNQRKTEELVEYQAKALYIADKCLPYLRHGLWDRRRLQKTADIIRDNAAGYGVLFTDRTNVLVASGLQLHSAALPDCVKTAMEEKRTMVQKHSEGSHSALAQEDIIAVPLREGERTIGSLSLLMRESDLQPRDASIRFAEALAQFFSTILELHNLDYQVEMRRRAELKMLQSQINPHFFYNALNTISALCRIDSSRARDLILILADYFRQSLSINEELVTLSDELRNVENYLIIERARFGSVLHLEMSLPENLEGWQIPPLVLQPLVENAIRHGAATPEQLTVDIRIHQQDEQMHFSISDWGGGFPEEILHELKNPESKRYSGLFNVNKRLRSLYGEAGSLRIVSTNRGSTVSFSVPRIPPKADWKEEMSA